MAFFCQDDPLILPPSSGSGIDLQGGSGARGRGKRGPSKRGRGKKVEMGRGNGIEMEEELQDPQAGVAI